MNLHPWTPALLFLLMILTVYSFAWIANKTGMFKEDREIVSPAQSKSPKTTLADILIIVAAVIVAAGLILITIHNEL